MSRVDQCCDCTCRCCASSGLVFLGSQTSRRGALILECNDEPLSSGSSSGSLFLYGCDADTFLFRLLCAREAGPPFVSTQRNRYSIAQKQSDPTVRLAILLLPFFVFSLPSNRDRKKTPVGTFFGELNSHEPRISRCQAPAIPTPPNPFSRL